MNKQQDKIYSILTFSTFLIVFILTIKSQVSGTLLGNLEFSLQFLVSFAINKASGL